MPVADPCALDGDGCAPLPDAFVRLRFFLGKRMGVADFTDLQRYPVAKQRFHNLRLHGSGVVAGLGLRRPDPTTEVLRVLKGAALDGCGREIIVGYDQCIDVAAWLAQKVAAHTALDAKSNWPASELQAGGLLPVYVGLRYRECNASPEPAPRDPCGCDDAGSDYGRVREGFELTLFTAGEADAYLTTPAFPPLDAIDQALRGSDGSDGLARALAAAVTGSQPKASDGWLLLGRVELTVTQTQRPDLSWDTELATLAIDDSFVPPLLLETAVLQDLVLRGLGATVEPAAFAAGAPAILEPELTRVDPAGTSYRITLLLSGPIVDKTLTAAAFVLHGFTPAAGWSSASASLTASYDSSAGPAIHLDIDNSGGFLVDGGLYRLTQVADRATPIVDAQMRPLTPLRFAWDFKLAADAATGALTAVAPPYVG